MNQLNSIILEGNIVADVRVFEPAAGFKKAVFSIGVGRYYKNRNGEDVNEASFFDVEAYGVMTDYLEEKGKKGRGVRVVGRLKQDTWKNAEGKSASRVYVVAEHIEYKPVKIEEPEAGEEKASEPQPAETEESVTVF